MFTHGPNTGHKVTVGGEFGHETISRVVKVGKNVKDFQVGERVYPYPRYAKDDTKRAAARSVLRQQLHSGILEWIRLSAPQVMWNILEM